LGDKQERMGQKKIGQKEKVNKMKSEKPGDGIK